MSTTHGRSPWRLIAVPLVLGIVALAVETVLAPIFLGRDVATIALLLQVPWVLTALDRWPVTTRREPCVLLGIAILLLWWLATATLPGWDRAWFAPWPGALLRGAIAGSLAVGCGLIACPARPPSRTPISAWVLVVWGGVAVVCPALFLQQRCDVELHRTETLLEQSRFAEAAETLTRLDWYPTDDQIAGRDRTAALVSSLSAVRDLAAELARLDHQPISSTIVERARLLAMLHREPEALALLAEGDQTDAALHNLRGVILESAHNWSAAREAFLRVLSNAPTKEEHAQTLRGIAFSERKLGNLQAAERAWLALLDLSPTAETYFLVGQFYEDAQQTAAATEHLAKAAELDPQRYAEPVQSLVRKMRRAHFGCFTNSIRR